MDNKKNILEKALLLFSRKGFDAAGIQEICEECAVTKPTLYHYFGSKRGLLDTIFDHHYPPFIEKIKEAAEYHHDIVINLESLAVSFFELETQDPSFARFSLIASFSPVESDVHDAQRKYASRINDLIRELFQLAVIDHGNMRNKERQLALSFIGLLQSYCGFALSNEIELNEQIACAVVKQFMHGIFS
ncbi:MAG TPA: TetR/AcrR family transcriptional regulator [Chitinispirillaceae bacterium]|nr:TetR/AcrR family transcriptional regulator [Chitinispirillaceae bacterium]